MQKSNTVCKYSIRFYFFVAVVIYTVIHAFVSLSPVLPTEAFSHVFKYNLSYDRISTSLRTSSVHINIAGNGGDKNIRINDIYRKCNMSY